MCGASECAACLVVERGSLCFLFSFLFSLSCFRFRFWLILNFYFSILLPCDRGSYIPYLLIEGALCPEHIPQENPHACEYGDPRACFASLLRLGYLITVAYLAKANRAATDRPAIKNRYHKQSVFSNRLTFYPTGYSHLFDRVTGTGFTLLAWCVKGTRTILKLTGKTLLWTQEPPRRGAPLSDIGERPHILSRFTNTSFPQKYIYGAHTPWFAIRFRYYWLLRLRTVFSARLANGKRVASS